MTAGQRYAAREQATALVLVSDIAGDGPQEVAGPDGHHLVRVRRVAAGEHLVVADGSGLWRRCVVTEVGERALTVAPEGPVFCEPEPWPRLAVAFAPAKGDTAADVVHQLVELGTDRIVPVATRRGVVRWEGARAERALERLRRVAREAAMQARRARVPRVEPISDLARLAGHPGLVLADPGGVPASEIGAPPGDEWLVLVGPEGGLEPEEIATVRPWRRLGIGPHTLRAATAPAAAAAALAGRRRWAPPGGGCSTF